MAFCITCAAKYTKGSGDFFTDVAKQWKVRLLLCCKTDIVGKRVNAGHVIAHIVFTQQMAVFRQRFTFDGATAGVGLGKPCHNHPGSVGGGQFVCLAIGAWQCERRRGVSDLQLCGRLGWESPAVVSRISPSLSKLHSMRFITVPRWR